MRIGRIFTETAPRAVVPLNMEIIIKPDYEAMSREAALIVARAMRDCEPAVLGLATGSTPEGMYRELVRLHRDSGLSFSTVTTFNLDEYVGLSPDHEQSYHAYMRWHLFDHVDIEPDNVHIPNGMSRDVAAFCSAYENAIKRAGGIDVQVLGLGHDGHIGFNEPSSSLGSRTRIKTLTRETVEANARYFSDPAEVPKHVITMGVGTIMESRHCLVLVSGKAKAGIVREAVEGPVTSMVPASALQFHPKCSLVLDEEAASELQRADYYRWIYDNKPDWQRV
jgi:glucosamine-6-phosphate deaminase